MSIPLPIPAWWVMLTHECNYDNSPLGEDFEKYDLGLNEEEFPELYVKREFPEARLKGDPRVVEHKAVWYICPFHFTRRAEKIDGVDAGDYFHERLGGEWVGNCGGEARVYTKRSEALADLAKCDLGVGLVWKVARARAGEAKKLAAAVLEGDLGVLPVLADKLEEEGHELAAQVRELCEPLKKKGRVKKK
jgi:hypothetical protein